MKTNKLNLRLQVIVLLTDAEPNDAGMVIRVQVQIKNGLGYKQQIVGLQRKILIQLQETHIQINGTPVLSGNTLGAGVTASRPTTVGTLVNLDVDNINIPTVVQLQPSGMTINANGDVNFANPKITAIATSSNATDAASKQYVDESTAFAISFSMDVTGLNDTQIGLVLNDSRSAGTVANGTTARIHCTTLGGASVTGIDINPVTTHHLWQ